MLLTVALLGGGAVLLGMQLTSSRSTELARSNMTALYCAEAGLNTARSVVANNYPLWNAALATPTTQPTWLDASAIDHDLDDGLASDDFKITLKDNEDEAAFGLANDPSSDNDLQIYIVSTCLKFPENQKRVSELIRFNIGGKCYDVQAKGCGANNNAN